MISKKKGGVVDVTPGLRTYGYAKKKKIAKLNKMP